MNAIAMIQRCGARQQGSDEYNLQGCGQQTSAPERPGDLQPVSDHGITGAYSWLDESLMP